MQSHYENLLRHAARSAGIDANLLCQTEEIEIDGLAVGMRLEPAEGCGDLELFSIVGQLPSAPPQALLRTLLEANYLGVGTGGCALAIQQESNAVLLWGRFPVERLDGERFQAVLVGFAQVGNFWRERLDNGKPGGRPFVPNAI